MKIQPEQEIISQIPGKAKETKQREKKKDIIFNQKDYEHSTLSALGIIESNKKNIKRESDITKSVIEFPLTQKENRLLSKSEMKTIEPIDKGALSNQRSEELKDMVDKGDSLTPEKDEEVIIMSKKQKELDSSLLTLAKRLRLEVLGNSIIPEGTIIDIDANGLVGSINSRNNGSVHFGTNAADVFCIEIKIGQLQSK